MATDRRNSLEGARPGAEPGDRPAPVRGGRKRRASKGFLRVAAWTAGAATFVTSGAAIAMAPRPAAGATAELKPQVIIIRKTIKRIVWQQAPVSAAAPRVKYVYVGGGGGGGSASAPAPARTCGSHPC